MLGHLPLLDNLADGYTNKECADGRVFSFGVLVGEAVANQLPQGIRNLEFVPLTLDSLL